MEFNVCPFDAVKDIDGSTLAGWDKNDDDVSDGFMKFDQSDVSYQISYYCGASSEITMMRRNETFVDFAFQLEC